MTDKGNSPAESRFHAGDEFRAYRYFGVHRVAGKEESGSFVFRLWAPGAQEVRVVGSFCGWMDEGSIRMTRLEEDPSVFTGIGHGLKEYDTYKYRITTSDGRVVYKSDPFGVHMETRPSTGSKIFLLDRYSWEDDEWMRKRKKIDWVSTPLNIYEVHAGSWKKKEDGSFLDYRQLADELSEYASCMGYTHIELMPMTEYPLDPSWGYQVMGYFAPTSRYGTPDGLKYLVDRCHRKGIGVIMDWVPAHFPKDESGLAMFDGTPLFEYGDLHKGEHPEWGTKVFDFGKGEVISFLISSCMYWLEMYHLDGIRVDAVSSMLYLDYGRQDGEWEPNILGGRENLEAADFLRKLNCAVHASFPGVFMAAEESSTYPKVTGKVEEGGLGFDFKWNMGWMNDVLRYVQEDPYFRKHVHGLVTFSMMYAFSENFVLPLSHDEVVHGKRSLISKQFGEYEDKFAGLRTLLGFMMAHPGKKLLFMGGEIGQFIEWNPDRPLDWFLLDYPMHRMMQDYVKALNHLYLRHPSMYEVDDSWKGFQWVSCDDAERNILALRRIDRKGKELVFVFNFAPVRRDEYRLGMEVEGTYEEIFSSDDICYGGNGIHNTKPIKTEKIPVDGKLHSISVTIPPLSCLCFSVKKKPGRKSL